MHRVHIASAEPLPARLGAWCRPDGHAAV